MTRAEMIDTVGSKLGPRAAIGDTIDALREIGVLMVEGDEPAKEPEVEPVAVKRGRK